MLPPHDPHLGSHAPKSQAPTKDLRASVLPFQILGQVAPILAWAEGDFGARLPATWMAHTVPYEERERAWLLNQLPTYSYDNVSEIRRGARSDHPKWKPTKLQRRGNDRPSLSPPPDYDLVQAFRELYNYFFLWNGTEFCIREGRMEELHELAIRLPVGHIVRHGHARTVSENVLQFEDALRYPELVTLLPSNSFGLRSVVRKGLSESHLHLKAVTSAEETWADNLLKPLSFTAFRAPSEEHRRLLMLNLFAGKILAIALWNSLIDEDGIPSKERGSRQPVNCNRLLQLMDDIYFARSQAEAQKAGDRLKREISLTLYGHELGDGSELDDRLQEEWKELLEKEKEKEAEDERKAKKKGAPHDEAQEREEREEQHQKSKQAREENQTQRDRWRKRASRRRRRHGLASAELTHQLPRQYRFLLRWIAPTAYHMQVLRQTERIPGSTPESPQDRYRFVNQLHLAAHLQLVKMSRLQNPKESEYREYAYLSEEERRAKRKRKATGALDIQRDFMHQALFRYLVCRTHHWQMATQQGRTTGLSHFRDFYASDYRKPKGLSQIQYAELVFDRLRQWKGLRVLEGRVKPPRSSHELVPWILAFSRPEAGRIEKMGLVVHFKKEEEAREEKSFAKADNAPVPRLRWRRRRRLIKDEAMRLFRILQQPNPVTPFVVGIDACNLELATPPEVFAPVFRFLRELPIPISRASWRHSPYYQLRPAIAKLVRNRRLGMTYHVGEDFRHLLSGLRAICEVVDFLEPQPGDRLGHGTALALLPEDWLSQNGYQAVMPKLEYLDTLVWVHHFLGPGDDIVGELGIEDRIQRCSWEVYGPAGQSGKEESLGVDTFDPLGLEVGPGDWKNQRRYRGLMDWDWSPLTLWDAWTLRQLDPYSLHLNQLFHGKLEMRPQRGYCEEDRRWHSVQDRILRKLRKGIGSRNAYYLLGLYWMSPKVRKAGSEITVVDMQDQGELWLELCRRTAKRMRELIHQKELVVEVNPSSNRIIGPFDRYGQHHVFHLTLDENQKIERSVRVSVNTDNPAVCNTTLAHEHYLLGELLMKRGVPEAEAVRWLDWLRQNGNEYSFVRRMRTADEDPDMAKVIHWLRGLRPGVLEARDRESKFDAFWRWQRETNLRSRGFTAEDIEVSAHLVDRIATLEARLRELQRTDEEQPGSSGTLDGLLKDIQDLKRQMQPANRAIVFDPSGRA